MSCGTNGPAPSIGRLNASRNLMSCSRWVKPCFSDCRGNKHRLERLYSVVRTLGDESCSSNSMLFMPFMSLMVGEGIKLRVALPGVDGEGRGEEMGYRGESERSDPIGDVCGMACLEIE